MRDALGAGVEAAVGDPTYLPPRADNAGVGAAGVLAGWGVADAVDGSDGRWKPGITPMSSPSAPLRR